MNYQKEIWKDIEGYEGLYQVSNTGKVKALLKKRWIKRNNSIGIRKEKILLYNKYNYYPTVTLYKNGKHKGYTVHRLVAVAFLKHKPDGTYKTVVDHIDNNPLNNNEKNLQLMSQRDNVIKSINKSKTSSKYVGVHWSKESKKYIARIYKNGIREYLGIFNTEIEAYNAILLTDI